MQPKTDITIYRTKGDTDPIIFDLRVNTNGVTTKVSNTALVELILKFDTLVTINGNNTANGIFSFPMLGVNTANHDLAKFEVKVTSDFQYVIGSGAIYFKDRMS